MNTIRRDSYVYPGFETAGIASPGERFITAVFCFAARLLAAAYDVMSARR